MRILLTILLVLLSGPVSSGSISIFGKQIEFKEGEFINPYESHKDSRGVVSIVIDRSCKASECSGEIIIGPIIDSHKVDANYGSYSEPEFTSSCASNILLKSYYDNILSLYHTNDYEYHVMFIGSESNFLSFEKKLCIE